MAADIRLAKGDDLDELKAEVDAIDARVVVLESGTDTVTKALEAKIEALTARIAALESNAVTI